MTRKIAWTAIEAPLDSSGTSRGEERAPAALRQAGLFKRLGADVVVVTEALIRNPGRDPTTGMIAVHEVLGATSAIAAAVRTVLADGGRKPLVVGGDCTVLLGVFLALPRGVRLWFVDGHADFEDGESSTTGEAADMDLAILTGYGPAGIFDDRPPLVDPGSVTLLGHRPDHVSAEVARENARIDPAIHALTADEVRNHGAAAVGREIAGEGQPTWLHVDLDVLDERALPAVTYRQPGGLGWEDVIALAGPLAGASRLVGVSIADFNPDLDPTGRHARQVADTFAAMLA